MKISSLLLVGAALIVIPTQMARADDDTTPGQTTPSNGSTNSGDNVAEGRRFERLKQAFAQLNLTDAQKAQIKQIRATVTDRKERRHEIMAVLTSDQKAKLRELIREHRQSASSGSGASSTSDNSQGDQVSPE